MSRAGLARLANQLEASLKLKTYSVGLKLFKKAEEMEDVKSKAFGQKTTLCQAITASRVFGWTLRLTENDLLPLCAYVAGLSDSVSEKFMSAYGEVWFRNKEDALKKYKTMPHIPSEYQGLIISPLAVERIEPDIILIFGTPAQMIRIINGLQWQSYERFQMFSVGETSCVDSIAQAYISAKPAITIPCFGHRRFGHVQDDEMIAAIPLRLIEGLLGGLEAMDRAGIRYPIPYFGIQSDVMKGMPVSYLVSSP
jgi:uncharacterized protein (DUF169 family)